MGAMAWRGGLALHLVKKLRSAVPLLDEMVRLLVVRYDRAANVDRPSMVGCVASARRALRRS